MVPTHPTSRYDGRGGTVTARPQATTAPRAWDRARVSPLHLHLSATSEEVPFARAAITRLCEQLDLDDGRTERIRLAVTEACTNCVLHAYDAGAIAPTYVLSARSDPHELSVVVCDRGVGISNARPSGHEGFGLALIQQLADGAEIARRLGGGTKVVMHFRLRS
jgi:anti-sigma regulatory factor (Ser/Thr protein kinase)